jgi:hypothetical protein
MIVAWVGGAEGVDYKAYYNRLLAQHLESFTPPAVGSELQLTLKNKSKVAGTLNKLSMDAVTVETTRGAKTYTREALSDESKALLFAEDYAKAMAYEKTRNSKFHNETAERLARGEKLKIALSVKDDIDEDKEKEVDAGDYSSETKISKESICSLDLSLVNQSPFDTIVNLRWYFVTEEHGEGTSERVVNTWGGSWTPLKKQARHRRQVDSPVFKLTEVIREFESEDNGSTRNISRWGRECIGYLVVVKYKDTILAMESSDEEFQTPEFLAGLPVPEHEKPKTKSPE